MPVYNHPISFRLAPTNYNFNGTIEWITYSDFEFNTIPHGTTDGVYPDDLIQPIPNVLDDIKGFSEDPKDIDVADSQEQEIARSSNQGGAYVNVPKAITNVTINSNIGTRNTVNLLGHAQTFMEYARAKGFTYFNIFAHGQCDRRAGLPNETSTIAAPLPGFDTPDQFDNQDPTISSYLTFNSAESTVPQFISSNLFSIRKSLHHGFIQVNTSGVAGISMASGIGGLVYITSHDLFDWNNVQGLSAGGLCIFNQYTTPTNESISALNTLLNPTTVSCSNYQGTFVGIQGTNAVFTNFTTTANYSMFSNRTTPAYFHTGQVIAADPSYPVTGRSYNWSINPLKIRPQYAPSYGSGNYLAFGPRATTSPNLITGLGISVGSYIRISGSQSNNGIYQVRSILDGVPGDTVENTSIAGGPLYQYIELSRNIVPENSSPTKTITVENVSHMPVLHIKYRELVQS